MKCHYDQLAKEQHKISLIKVQFCCCEKSLYTKYSGGIARFFWYLHCNHMQIEMNSKQSKQSVVKHTHTYNNKAYTNKYRIAQWWVPAKSTQILINKQNELPFCLCVLRCCSFNECTNHILCNSHFEISFHLSHSQNLIRPFAITWEMS